MKVIEYDDQKLKFIQVKNDDGFECVFCNLGAAIFAIKMDDKYLTQTPAKTETFKRLNVFHGKTIGRVGNRIENACFILDGTKYKLEANEGPNSLHSGSDGFSNKCFNSQIKYNNNSVDIIYTYLSKDLEGGFPGNFSITVTYTIFNNQNSILLKYQATCDKKCPVGITNHSYFTLGSKNLNELSLMIKANRFIDPRPRDLIPLSIKDVNSIMDFRIIKPIMKDINDQYLVNSKSNGYDHHFCFEKVNTKQPQIVLANKEYKMEIFTNFNGLQIYTDNYEDDDALWHNVEGKKNRTIAIEPQDSLLERIIINPQESYERFIEYKFFRIS